MSATASVQLPGSAHPGLRLVPALPHVAVVGMGYVGLPTAIGLASAGFQVTGIDTSETRLEEISAGTPDISPVQRERLGVALESPNFALASIPGSITAADAVVICVPTPVDESLRPDLRFLETACGTVVARAQRGQTIILTSTSYVGTTRELLDEPLRRRGLTPGEDVFVAFSPERIDPGTKSYEQEAVPRVVGGVTEACTEAAAHVLGQIASCVHRVSCPEAAELTKLYENTFRAVNIAFANEMADATRSFGLDFGEVSEAAATKPYGFMRFAPGAGVGGHCIPCDPHYLLEGLHDREGSAPIMEHAMAAIATRPEKVAARVIEILETCGLRTEGARVLVVGAAYKPGVRDVRESPAVAVLEELVARGTDVCYHDPLVSSVRLSADVTMLSRARPEPDDYDLVVLVTAHPGSDYSWLDACERVLDCTYGDGGGHSRFVI
jgi:nucleotide sugar dehydrogenase